MKQPLWISVAMGLSILAEGADARVLQEIMETRDHVLGHQIPSVSEGIKLLALQADAQREAVTLSFAEYEEFDLGTLSEEEERALVIVYGLDRKITFLSDRVIVHPCERIVERLKSQNSGGGFYLSLGSRRVKS